MPDGERSGYFAKGASTAGLFRISASFLRKGANADVRVSARGSAEHPALGDTHMPTETKEHPSTTFGAIVFYTDFAIVRAKTVKTEDGWRLQVTVHRREGEREILPRGYMIGTNILWFDDN